MKEIINDVLGSCSTIADRISSERLNQIINYDICIPDENKKITLSLIGQPFNELFDILYGLLNLKPIFSKKVQRISKSYSIKFAYGEEEAFRIIDTEGNSTLVNKEEFENFMTEDIEDDDNQIISAEVNINADLLKTIDINLICTKNNFEDINWISQLTGTDYGILVLSAASLLSITEKRFLRGAAAKFLGYGRLAVLINNIDKVDEIGRKEVEESARHFFSTIDEKIPIFYYSASSVLNANSNNEEINEEYANFSNYITENIIPDSTEIRKNSIRQSLMICISETARVVKELKENYMVDKNKIEAAICEIKDKSTELETKKASAGRRIEMFINGAVKVKLMSKIDEFNELIKSDVRDAIYKNNDIERYQKSISLYIERTWGNFFEQQEPWIKNSIYEEVNEVLKAIQNDMVELVAGIDSEVRNLIIKCISSRFNFDTISNAKIESNNWALSLSKYLSIGGLALFLINVPLAIITVGTSQALKFIFKDSIENDKKDKLAAMVEQKCDELKNDIADDVNIKFEDIIENIKREIEDMYDKLVDILITSLEEQKALINNSQEMLIFFDEIEKEILPSLIDRIKE